jgi:polysaccharide biosynthesis transport protein
MIDERSSSTPGHPPGASAAPAGGHQPARPNQSGSGNLHIYDRLGVVVKYWKAVAVVFVIAASVVLYRAYSQIPEFDAKAQLYIDEEVSAEANVNSPLFAYTDPEVYLQTQLRILRSRDLAKRAVERLHLETVPEFNGQGPTPTKLTGTIAAIKRKIVAPFGGPAAAPAPTARQSNDPEQYVDAFLSHVSPELQRGTRLLDLHYRSTDPEFARKAVNILAEEYVGQNLENKTKKIRNEYDFISQQIEEQTKTLRERQNNLNVYREEKDALSLNDKQNIVVQNLTTFSDTYNKAKTDRITAEAAFNAVNRPDAHPENNPVVVNTPGVQAALTRLNVLLDQKSKLSQRYGANNPVLKDNEAQVIAAQKAFDNEVQKTVQGMKTELEAARAKEAELLRQLDSAQASAQDLNRKGVNYDELARQAKTEEELYVSAAAAAEDAGRRGEQP